MNSKALWSLAIFNLFSKMVKTGIFAFLGATAALKWSELDGFAKVCIFLAAGGQMLTVIEAFTDQTAARLAAGKPPIGTNGSGNTEHFVKQQDEKTTTSSTVAPGS
jgi:hypothetical protein